jgi:hypothetical protein
MLDALYLLFSTKTLFLLKPQLHPHCMSVNNRVPFVYKAFFKVTVYHPIKHIYLVVVMNLLHFQTQSDDHFTL